MNRLIIIGNGFDLAHGLPTSYRDFIDDFWIGIKSKFDVYSNNSDYEDEFVKIDYRFNNGIAVFYDVKPQVEKINGYIDFRSFITKYSRKNSHGINIGSVIIFKNNLFKNICEIHSIQNWVDVENVYYEILKSKTKGEDGKFHYIDSVEVLNKEFEEVKKLLEKYLDEKIKSSYKFHNFNGENLDWIKMLNILRPISLINNELNLFDEFKKVEDKNDIKSKFEIERREEVKNHICYLNFNYTPTIQKYIENLNQEKDEVKLIHIHGELLNDENQINFGFGDEMDEDYKKIENINDNEYLKNFKSFQYLQNNNYDNLLSYIDSEKYQVIILGHSCGLSDRTLLNTIFEHDNCRSIKPYYYEIKNEEGKVLGDNYIEIIQNISRHFNDKKLMREKIVNKTLCLPLPQIQLPKK